MQEGDTAVLIREYEQKALALQAERDVFDQQLIPKCLDNALAQTQNVGGVLDGLLHSMHTLKQSSSIDDSSGEECQRLVEFLKEKIAESDKLCKSLEYLTLFREVLVLRSRISSNGSLVQAQIHDFNQMCSVWKTLVKTMPDQRLLLRAWVYTQLKESYAIVDNGITQRLHQALAAIGWPAVIDVRSGIPSALAQQIESCIVETLPLHPLPKENDNYGCDSMEEDDKEATLIFRVMAAPLIARLRFHFSGSRPTNRIEKPEWIFEQVLDTINKNSAFVTDFIEPILRRHMAKTAGSTTIIDAKTLFIKELLEFVTSKMEKNIKKIKGDPSLLLHYVLETMRFDDKLRIRHIYHPDRSSIEPWPGCIALFTENIEYLHLWCRYEIQAAQTFLDGILDSSDGWETSYGGLGEDVDVNKVTKSAQSVVRLVESLTARYQLLPRAKYRLQFFSQVHLHILQVYFDKINRMIDQQEHVFNTATKLHDEVQKVGLYCRLVSSLMFIVGEMGRWEAEPFYLDVWNAMSDHSKSGGENQDDAPGVFAELKIECENLSERLFKAICSVCTNNLFEALWKYDKKKSWGEMKPEGSVIDYVSVELVDPLQTLSLFFGAAKSYLPESQIHDFLKTVAAGIDKHIYQKIVMRNKFSKHGGMQLLFDIDQGICGKMGFKMFASSTRSESNYFKRIRDVCGLLARPLKRSSTSVSSAQISSNSSTLPTISEIIEQIEQNEKGAEEGWLLEILGIYRLRLEEVLDVIQRRSDIS